MKSQPIATITENNISIYMNGVLYPPIHKSHTNFEKIKTAIKDKNWSVIPDLIDVAKTVKKYLSKQSSVRLEDGVLFYKDKPLNNHITKRVLALLDEGFDFKPLLNFIENLHQNPSFRAVNELYSFLEHFALPITEDGHFLAYKAVRNNYFDIYSGKFDNSVGKRPSVDRNTVDENKDNHCSHGLHVGAITYVTQYGAFGSGIQQGGNRLMIVKVNPADAVSVPGDHNCTKLRVCAYEVIGEITDIKNILDRAVYTAKGDTSEAKINNSDLDSDDSDGCDDCGCGCEEEVDDSLTTDQLSASVPSDTEEADEYFKGKKDGKNDADLGFPYENPGVSTKYDRGYKNAYRDAGVL